MQDDHWGTVYFTNGDDPMGFPEFKDFTIESNGWLTVEVDGSANHYPPTSIDHVEVVSDR